MTVPSQNQIRSEVLSLLQRERHQDFHLRAIQTAIATQLKLTPEDQAEMLPSGLKTKFESRLALVLFQLKKDEQIVSSAYGRYQVAPADAEEASGPEHNTSAAPEVLLSAEEGDRLGTVEDTQAAILAFFAERKDEPDAHWAEVKDYLSEKLGIGQDDAKLYRKLENRTRNVLYSLATSGTISKRGLATYGLVGTNPVATDEPTEPASARAGEIPVRSDLMAQIAAFLSTNEAVTVRDIVERLKVSPPLSRAAKQATYDSGAKVYTSRVSAALYGLHASGKVAKDAAGKWSLARGESVLTQEDVETVLREAFGEGKGAPISQADLAEKAIQMLTEAGQQVTLPEIAALLDPVLKQLSDEHEIESYDGLWQQRNEFASLASATRAIDSYRSLRGSNRRLTFERLDGGLDVELNGAGGYFEALGLDNTKTKITQGTEFIVLGRQGSGKSALMAHLVKSDGSTAPQSSKDAIVTPLETERVLSALTVSQNDKLSTEFEWRARFFLEHAKWLLDPAQSGTRAERSRGARLARRRLARYLSGLNPQGGRLTRILGMIFAYMPAVAVSSLITLDFSSAGRRQRIAASPFDIAHRLEDLTGRYRRELGARAHVIAVDRLDHSWRDVEVMKTELAGMILAALALNSVEWTVSNTQASGAPSGLKVVLFLRTDVFNLLKREVLGESRVKLNTSVVFVEWDEKALVRLLEKRIAWAFTEREQKELMRDLDGGALIDAFLPGEKLWADGQTSKRTVRHLVATTRHLPRDLLLAVGRVIATASADRAKGPEAVLKAVQSAISEASQNALESCIGDHLSVFPDLEEWLHGLRGGPTVYETPDALVARLSESLARDLGGGNAGYRIALDLYRAGVLGYLEDSEDTDLDAVFCGYRDAPYDPNFSSTLIVHESLHRALQLRDAAETNERESKGEVSDIVTIVPAA